MPGHVKFYQNWLNVSKDKSLNISRIWHANAYLHFLRCFVVKIRRKLKLSALSSFYGCTNLELKLQWLISSMAPNFIKISESIAEISHLTIFFKWQRPKSWFFSNLTFWTTVMLWIANMCHRAKCHQNWSNVCKDIVKVWQFQWFGMKTVICTFFSCFGVMNWRKLKFFSIVELTTICQLGY